MNKRQARLFAIGSSLLAMLAFIGLTIDSHRQFGKLTNADKITAEVSRGKDVWHNNNCINCHTVFGEGAYYAPDLTKITKLRGNAYLTAYLRPGSSGALLRRRPLRTGLESRPSSGSSHSSAPLSGTGHQSLSVAVRRRAK